MLATDVFGLVSGVAGFLVIAVSLCNWVSPWRRLRELDATMEKALRMLVVMQEEHVFPNHRIVRRAYQQLYWCVKSTGHVPLIVLTRTHTRPRQQVVHFRLQLMGVVSPWDTTLVTFSSLPVEIARVHRQVQSVLDGLQVSGDGIYQTDVVLRFTPLPRSSTSDTSYIDSRPFQ
jgi:hypothetical protein